MFLARTPEEAAAAVSACQAAGWNAMVRLSAAPPAGEGIAGWAPADLSAVELAHHWLFAHAVQPADDVLVLVDRGDEAAAAALAELRRDPRVAPLPEGVEGAASCPPVLVELDPRETEVLARLHDPVALAEAAERSGDQGWVLRPSTLLELREGLLRAAAVPPEDPAWGQGGWVWWRHMDSVRAATMLEDLLARADRHGWPSAPRLRLSLGVCRLLFADTALTLGLLERALIELQTEPANDHELLARLGLVIARDRAGQDSRPLMEETAARAVPHGSARLRAQVLDAQGAAHHRAGRIAEAIRSFREGAALASQAGVLRLEALMRIRALEVAITSARIEPDLEEIRALRRQVAAVGGVRAAMTVLVLLGDVARRLGALDEAAEAYTALAGLSPGSPAPLGFAQIALERQDFDLAATLLREALHSREPTGRRPTHLVEALSLPLYEHRADLGRWEAALDAWPLAVRGGHIDVARAAEAAAELAWAKAEREAGVRAARATRLAMACWRALGRPDRAIELRDQAARRHALGWPVPLGPLDLLAPVARGGTSVVWRARHRELDLEVAVKVLTGDQARDPAAVAALDAEVRATARLRHPHIVAVRDLGVVDDLASALADAHLPEGSPFVALEWVGGGTLARRPAPLPWEAIQAALSQVLDALGHAHGAGLIHRDVKPENVLWAGEERGRPVVKLVDFGLVGVGGELIAGTPSYMAPEQFRGVGVGPASDLYAVGCLAVALVQGRPPFSGRGVRELHAAHTRDPVPPLQPRVPVPAGLARWLEGLLAKDPADRFPTAGAARIALEALGPPETLEVQPRVEIAADESSTIVLSDLDDSAPEPASSGPRVVRPLAPVPPWRDGITPPFPRPLGRALAGMGTPPMVGRGAAQAALWRALRETSEGAPGAVVVRGPVGVGVSHLLRWFATEVRAAGCALVLEGPTGLVRLWSELRRGLLTLVTVDAPDQADEAALVEALEGARSDRAPLLVIVGARDQGLADRWEGLGAGLVTLERLGLEQLVVLARDVAPLRGDVALDLARAADGSPGVLIRGILDGLAAGGFIPSRAGLVPRPGAAPTLRHARGARGVLGTLRPDQLRAATVVALLGEHPAAVRQAWAWLGLEEAAASVAYGLEEQGGRMRILQPGAVPALLQAALEPALLDACAEALEGVPGPEALARRVSLVVRAGRAAEGVDLLAELAWSWPGDAGELRLRDLAREANDALAATGAPGRNPRWGRLALVEARAALLGVDFERAAEAIRRAEATDLPEAAERIPYLRAVAAASLRGPEAALVELDAALSGANVADDPALRLRYAILYAAYRRDTEALTAAAEAADALGLHRLAGDAWRSLSRHLESDPDPGPALDALTCAVRAYAAAGSAYGEAISVDARAMLRLRGGDLEGFLSDAERAAGPLTASLGAVSVQIWLHLAVARLLSGRADEAADGLAAAMALGLGRLPGSRRMAGLLAVVFAADAPSAAWIHATDLLQSEDGDPRHTFERPLLERAMDAAEAAGLGERVLWLRGLAAPAASAG